MTASRGFALVILSLVAASCGVKPVNAPGAPVDTSRPDAAPVTRPPDASVPPARPEVGPTPACSGDACVGQELGARCQNAGQCASGFCADGVCCNSTCSGGCVQCNLPGREGECAPAPAGQPDPHRQCRQDAPASCGQSGVCNGQGGCSKYAAGTRCGAAACDGNRQIPAGECDGAGLCIQGAAVDCAPFTCDSGACRQSCTGDGQCVAPNVCVGGSCGKRGKGQSCTGDVQCASGFCVDGVCCDGSCAGRCRFCAFPDSRGTCTSVRADAPDPRAASGVTDPARVCLDQGAAACGTDGRCDGNGGCRRYGNGTSCRAARCSSGDNTETGAGSCQSGVCVSPAARSCAPYRGCSGTRCRTGCDREDQCASPNVCVDGSCGKRPTGALCSRPTDCASGLCAQGRCCLTACTASCMSCGLDGSAGTCSPVPAGGADPAGACRDDACNNGCDGRGACRREPAGTTCQTARCAGTAAVSSFTCTAVGVCQMQNVPCPAGSQCRVDRCVPVCPPGQAMCGGVMCCRRCNNNVCSDHCPVGELACGKQCCTRDRCVNGACLPPPDGGPGLPPVIQ
jgi:hypothetical protein